jgi:hypothetical protein
VIIDQLSQFARQMEQMRLRYGERDADGMKMDAGRGSRLN